MLITILDLLVIIFIIPALWFMGNKNRICFPFYLVSNVLSIIVCYYSGLWGLIAANGIFMVFNIRGWIKWKKVD